MNFRQVFFSHFLTADEFEIRLLRIRLVTGKPAKCYFRDRMFLMIIVFVILIEWEKEFFTANSSQNRLLKNILAGHI